VRIFVALNLPAAVRRAAWEAAEPLRFAAPTGVTWVREEALHVTLRFLGEQPPALADDLAARLDGALRTAAPPRIELSSAGAFPDLRRPRVLWLGGPTNSALTELYHHVERSCSTLGFDPEDRAFRLHVTIGRVRQGARVDAGAVARAAVQVAIRAAFTAATVDVMESELSAAGPRYRVVAAVPIGPRG
jgi:RNA 2',3'-cyclic 3'-phosphodiesterase